MMVMVEDCNRSAGDVRRSEVLDYRGKECTPMPEIRCISVAANQTAS